MNSVLIIDDDARSRMDLALIMSAMGWEVSVGDDGLIVDDLSDVCRFDLIITDIAMPGRDGLQTIMHVRRKCPELPIIAMSGGHPDPASNLLLLAAMKIGATATLSKPLTESRLLACLTESGLYPARAARPELSRARAGGPKPGSSGSSTRCR